MRNFVETRLEQLRVLCLEKEVEIKVTEESLNRQRTDLMAMYGGLQELRGTLGRIEQIEKEMEITKKGKVKKDE